MSFARQSEQQLKAEFANEFGENLTVRQLWVITKLVKHARRYCRSNAALNPAMERMFPNSRFQQVPKVDEKGEKYEGLQITLRGQTATDNERDEAA